MAEYKIIPPLKVNPIPYIWNGIYQTIPKTAEVHGARLQKTWLIFKEGTATQFYEKEDWDKTGLFISNRIINESDYIKKIYETQLKVGQELGETANLILLNNLANLDFKELLILYTMLAERWLEQNIFNVLPWFVGGDYIQAFVYQKLIKKSPNLTQNEFQLLIAPPFKSFSADEQLRLLKLAIRIKKEPKNPFTKILSDLKSLPGWLQKEIKLLSSDYFWIPFGYDGPQLNDEQHYLRTIQELSKNDVNTLLNNQQTLASYEDSLKNQQEEIKKRYSIDDETWRLIQDVQTLSIMSDNEKKSNYPAHVTFQEILEEISNRSKIDVLYLKYVLLDEIKKIKDPNELRAIGKRRAENIVVYLIEKGNISVIEGIEAEKLEKSLPQVVSDMIH